MKVCKGNQGLVDDSSHRVTEHLQIAAMVYGQVFGFCMATCCCVVVLLCCCRAVALRNEAEKLNASRKRMEAWHEDL